MTIARQTILDIFAAPFRPRRQGLLDRRSLSAHVQRDIGLLDGHAIPGGNR
ncbi:MAG: hypothetical protein AB7P20_08855 [Rhizobiaceae bacterium]